MWKPHQGGPSAEKAHVTRGFAQMPAQPPNSSEGARLTAASVVDCRRPSGHGHGHGCLHSGEAGGGAEASWEDGSPSPVCAAIRLIDEEKQGCWFLASSATQTPRDLPCPRPHPLGEPRRLLTCLQGPLGRDTLGVIEVLGILGLSLLGAPQALGPEAGVRLRGSQALQ